MDKILGNTTATTTMAEQTYNPESNKPQSGKAVATALANKVDKVSGKGLSTNDFTNALKTRLENNTFDRYIETYNENSDDITEYFDFDSYNAEGIYKIYERQRSDDTVSNHYILCVDTSGYEDVRQTLICLSTGEIKQRSYYGEWEKVSVSQNDIKSFATKTELTNAIGDIETSLENIITKYGLGGDSV